MSRSITSRGSGNGGTPASWVPPAWSSASKMVTPKPSFARSLAAARPAQPAPTIATLPRGGPNTGGGGRGVPMPAAPPVLGRPAEGGFFTVGGASGLSAPLRAAGRPPAGGRDRPHHVSP